MGLISIITYLQATWGLDLPEVQLFKLEAQEGLSNMSPLCANLFVCP